MLTKIKLRLKEGILQLLNAEIKKEPIKPVPTYTDYNSFSITPILKKKFDNELTLIAFEFFNNILKVKITETEILNITKEFQKIYPTRPFYNNSGGSGYHNMFWLFTATKILNPKIIVESGTHKGMSSWCLQKASEKSKIYCFDLNFKNLEFKSPSINYIEEDWGSYNFIEKASKGDLCFFDDHVNQALRIVQAYEKGFKTIIFDDAPPAHKLYTFGLPPFPTVPMLFDNDLKEKVKLEWKWQDINKSYEFDPNDPLVHKAKSLIKDYHYFPDVSLVSQFDKNKFLLIVNLI